MNIKTFRIGGIHPEENKLTHEAKTQVAALPKQAIFPLSQHIGAPAKPVVQKGDRVKVGTMIAEQAIASLLSILPSMVMNGNRRSTVPINWRR